MLKEQPHRRFNPLSGEWVLVSPARRQRPWQGMDEAPEPESRLAHDPQCYLCPGNERGSGERNPDYRATFVFQNDFPALSAQPGADGGLQHPLFTAHPEAGECRVLCYSPRHDLSLAELPMDSMRALISAWIEQSRELEQKWRWVQIFENRGRLMGASSPHPHGQIWATASLPTEISRELTQQRQWKAEHGTSLLHEYARLEIDRGERTVKATAHWLALVPWWAAWPYELLILPRRSVQRLTDLSVAEADDLAILLRDILTRYDGLFEVPFPYSFGWHGAPSIKQEEAGWQLHAHFYPPLLRSAKVRKFMVGYELLAEVQRDITPEQAAECLRQCAGR